MKGIKLVDVDLSEARTETTGTCELCFGSRWCGIMTMLVLV